jgi:hypothetical protein
MMGPFADPSGGSEARTSGTLKVKALKYVTCECGRFLMQKGPKYPLSA